MKLKERLKSIKPLRLAIPVLLFAAVVYFLFTPALKQYVELSSRIKNKENDLALVKADNEQYAKLKEEIKKGNAKIEELKESLFWDTDISKFLNELTGFASDLKIEFVSLKPLAPDLPGKGAKEEGDKLPDGLLVTKIPIEVEFRCGYNNLISFLKRIEDGKKFVSIEALNIEKQPQSPYVHNINMRLSILVEGGV